MTELLEDVRRRVLGIRRADWVHESSSEGAAKRLVKEGMSGKSMAGTIERFRSTVYSRMKKAEHYANKEDLDKAWKELDAAMTSIRSLTKAISIARHEDVVKESHEGNALSNDMLRLMDTVLHRFQRAEHLAAQGLEDDAWSELGHAKAAFQAMMGESAEFSEMKGEILKFGTSTFQVIRKYDSKRDATGPIGRDFLRTIPSGGGGALVKKVSGGHQAGYYFIALDSRGKPDGKPMWMSPANYKRAMRYD